MKYCIVVLVSFLAALGNVDIIIPETGQVPIVGWTDSFTPWLMYCQEPIQPVCLGSSCGELFLSLHTESDSEPVLLAVSGWSGWNEDIELRTIEPWNLSRSTYQEIHAYDFFPPVPCAWFSLPVLPRYTMCDDHRRLFMAMNTGYTDDSVQDMTWMTTVPVDPWAASLVNPVDTTSWRQSCFSTGCFLSEQVPQGDLLPFTLASGSWDGYPGPSFIGINTLYLDSDTLHENSLYLISGNYPAITPEPLSTGYSLNDQIALWVDTAGTVWCSDYSNSLLDPVSSVLDVSHSEQPFAAAMTKNRTDDGILLAWYDGSNVMVRHWQGEWNQYAHIVEPWTHVSPGNIAVCSDTDGYWVAWKDDLEMIPQYRYIPRGDVTEIDITGEPFNRQVRLSIAENPTAGAATCFVSLPPGEGFSLNLFDVYGRNLGQLTSGNGGDHSLVLDLSAYPSGVYSLVLSTENGVCSTRILKE